MQLPEKSGRHVHAMTRSVIRRSLVERYSDFAGRESRQEFWLFAVVAALLWLAGRSADYLFGWDVSTGSLGLWREDRFVLFESLIVLALAVPLASAAIRRLHDAGRSGWFLVLVALPVIGWLILFALLASGSDSTRHG